MIKNILNKLWRSNKEKVNGHWYVKLSDVCELLDNAKFIEPKKTEKKLTENDLASHMVNKGWIFERNPDTGEIWRREKGNYDNREKIS
tara:strand:+ start:66 stop:329 length:264 start_codon:yes stop_codon:yes gene_type:complete